MNVLKSCLLYWTLKIKIKSNMPISKTSTVKKCVRPKRVLLIRHWKIKFLIIRLRLRISRPFSVQKIPHSNLILLVVDTLCPCGSKQLSIEPQEVRQATDESGQPVNNCQDQNLYRRRSGKCINYHPEVSFDDVNFAFYTTYAPPLPSPPLHLR